MSAEVVTQMAARTVELVSESPFYIPMTGPAARPRRSLKHDDTFIVLDSHGDIGASAGGPDGLFNADTRYLARLELVLDDVQPLLLGSNLRDDNSALTVDLTNPDIYRDGRIVLKKDMLHIVRTIFLWRGTAYQRIGLQNHGDRPASFDLTLLFDNDFADLFEVRGEKRPRRGIGSGKLLGPTDVALEYKGLDGKLRSTALHFDPTDPSCRERRDLSSRSEAATGQFAICRRVLQQAGLAETGPFFRRIAGASTRDATFDRRRCQHRNLQQHLQRGAVPGDGRPQYPDDGDAAGTISLCGHSLVLHDIRP
jgi:glycogen debranching enzyme